MKNLQQLMLGGATGSNLTLAVAESITCGNLQARIGAISGASRFFLGGITAYTLEQKIRHLGVPRELAEPVNCVSEAVAVAMAEGAQKIFDADIAVATTGYAEPAPDKNITIPFAWHALVHNNIIIRTRIDCPNFNRTGVQQHVAEAALNALVNYLQSLAK